MKKILKYFFLLILVGPIGIMSIYALLDLFDYLFPISSQENKENIIGDNLFVFSSSAEGIEKVKYNEEEFTFKEEYATEFNFAGGEKANLCNEFVNNETGNTIYVYCFSSKILYLQVHSKVNCNGTLFNQCITYSSEGVILEDISPFNPRHLLENTYVYGDTNITSSLADGVITMKFNGVNYKINESAQKASIDDLSSLHNSLAGQAEYYVMEYNVANIISGCSNRKLNLISIGGVLKYFYEDLTYGNGSIQNIYNIDDLNITQSSSDEKIINASEYVSKIMCRTTEHFNVVCSGSQGLNSLQLDFFNDSYDLLRNKSFEYDSSSFTIKSCVFKFKNSDTTVTLTKNAIGWTFKYTTTLISGESTEVEFITIYPRLLTGNYNGYIKNELVEININQEVLTCNNNFYSFISQSQDPEIIYSDSDSKYIAGNTFTFVNDYKFVVVDDNLYLISQNIAYKLNKQ